MALQKAIERFGVNFPEAYHRVEAVTVSKMDGIKVIVRIYTNSSEANNYNMDMIIGEKSYLFNYDQNNTEPALPEAYRKLKTLNDYSGSMDV